MNLNTEASWKKNTGNPFATQNNFIKSAVNDGKNIFHQLTSSEVGKFSAEYSLEKGDKFTPSIDEKTMDVYFFCVTSSETLTATVTDGSIMENQNGTQTSTTTKTFSSTNQNYICHLGNVTPGSKITITASDNQAISSCYAYAFDNDDW